MSILSFLLGPADAGPLPYPKDSPQGLAARWVRWACSAPKKINPLIDETGQHAGQGQPDDVWFLAGCFGGSVNRSCKIPHGRPIFLPAFNMWTFGADGPPEPVEDAFGYIKVNGKELSTDLIATPKPFNVVGAKGNPVTGNSRKYSAVVYGLWKRLEPLSPGSHEICFGGGDGHGFEVDATYRVTITAGTV